MDEFKLFFTESSAVILDNIPRRNFEESSGDIIGISDGIKTGHSEIIAVEYSRKIFSRIPAVIPGSTLEWIPDEFPWKLKESLGEYPQNFQETFDGVLNWLEFINGLSGKILEEFSKTTPGAICGRISEGTT